MTEFKFEFNKTEAENADGSQYIKKGGFYQGSILSAEMKYKEKGATLELELITDSGERSGKIFMVLLTKEGANLDKNGNILSGRSQLSALLALLGLKVMVSGSELVNKKIAFLGYMKSNFSSKDQKDYLNFTVLNFMDYNTSQTYTEKAKKEEAKRCNFQVKDEVLLESSNHSESQSESSNNSTDENSLPF